jgi:hypothetical protein
MGKAGEVNQKSERYRNPTRRQGSLGATEKRQSFSEIKRLLNGYGYSEVKTGKTSDSRVAFYHEDRRHLIRLHKPHPQNCVKRYIPDYLEDELRKMGIL